MVLLSFKTRLEAYLYWRPFAEYNFSSLTYLANYPILKVGGMHLTITIKFISSQIEPNFLSPRLLAESDELINIAPPPRYSTISDSHMSTSSQGAESTPSANSLLSESGELEVPATGSSECKETPTSEAEWQARCVELELALQKFRDQAHNIRKLLRDKVRSIQYIWSKWSFQTVSQGLGNGWSIFETHFHWWWRFVWRMRKKGVESRDEAKKTCSDSLKALFQGLFPLCC